MIESFWQKRTRHPSDLLYRGAMVWRFYTDGDYDNPAAMIVQRSGDYQVLRVSSNTSIPVPIGSAESLEKAKEMAESFCKSISEGLRRTTDEGK